MWRAVSQSPSKTAIRALSNPAEASDQLSRSLSASANSAAVWARICSRSSPEAHQRPDDRPAGVDLGLVVTGLAGELDRLRSLLEAFLQMEMPYVNPGRICERPPLERRVALRPCDRQRALEGPLRLAVVSPDDPGEPAVLGEQLSRFEGIRGD